MPWCEPCGRYLTPSSTKADGTCPTCGSDVEAQERRTNEHLEEERAPWHFKLLVVALIAYLAWRIVDLFV
ncbi:MAG: hypothetical protein EBS20_07725 [Actinobacteria bacterium]|nr:hypothetical protein [Actinomycetota bacterium]